MALAALPDAAALRDRLYALFDDFSPTAVEDHEHDAGFRVFFRSPHDRDRAARAASDAFPQLDLRSAEIDDEDWARRSQADLRAVRVRRLIVAPPWDVRSDDSAMTIVIEPSMGFGTGHHATTRLCLDLLQDRDLTGAHLIDVGTGSGVLAIAAARLGAATVLAVDNDPDALVNARENATRSHEERIAFTQTDLRELAPRPVDLVLANLTAGVLVRHAPALQALVAPGGTLIVSGFGPHERDDVVGAFGWTPGREAIDGEWMAISLPRSA